MSGFKLSQKSNDFELAPEGNGRAVCVDVTPLVERQTQFGEKEEFRIVFELDPEAFGERAEGGRFAVWSRGFTASLSEKANLRKFLQQWFGRPLTSSELTELDPETFIGMPANIVVVHEVTDKGEFANIVACTPYRGKAPLQPSGKFVRKQDREANKGGAGKVGGGAGGGSQFRKAEQPADAGRDEWQKIKVHVGKHNGVELGDLPEAAVRALAEKWVPVALSKPKLLADDKRLVAGLAGAMAELNGEDGAAAFAAETAKLTGKPPPPPAADPEPEY